MGKLFAAIMTKAVYICPCQLHARRIDGGRLRIREALQFAIITGFTGAILLQLPLMMVLTENHLNIRSQLLWFHTHCSHSYDTSFDTIQGYLSLRHVHYEGSD